ncbi:chemotaxis protein CheW [Pelagicoccus sp. SDUM812003]|uniref:chemotaxis protein CheW n=1 Tax=Pelagicoccus sp. SDUM812003 TaxID=3041267 RepID=UPI0028105540|nr:chemotaxis protein CheW [Pelagicoccus sp. SDUM812003]MDQ8204335.1 chemotaxis protein CheW [Pelagicoccus sp. SDUM812003]
MPKKQNKPQEGPVDTMEAPVEAPPTATLERPEESAVSETLRGADENQLVTFCIEGQEFAFDIMSVQEIIRQPQMARIPMASSYVEGVANLRGNILPVIDTRARFGLSRSEETDQTRVLVLDIDGTQTGLRVDQVRQVTRVQSAEEEPPPEVVKGVSEDFLRSVIKLDDGKRIILELDPKAVCRIGDSVRSQSKGGKKAGLGESASSRSSNHENTDAMEQIVTFQLGEEEFAFPMDKVREILRVQRPSAVPDTPEHVMGVLTIRDKILPVIDLRILLGQTPLTDGIVADVESVREQCVQWLESTRNLVRSKDADRIEVTILEQAQRWVYTMNPASQVLIDTLAKIRNGLDNVTRDARKLATLSQESSDEKSPAHAFFENAVEGSCKQVIDSLKEYVLQVPDNVLEDQRLIVVDALGAQLALVVDKVREVMNVSRDDIEASAGLNSEDGAELSGIAKLDEGKRLILILESSKLLDERVAAKLKALGGDQTGDGLGEREGAGAHGKGASSDEQQYITFRLAEEEYAIPINQIQEIDRYSKMTRTPKAPAYMEGVANLRGEVIPVINARTRFDLEGRTPDDRTRVIIMDRDGKKTGLMVDSVNEVLNLAARDIAAPPATMSHSVDREFISGIGKINSGKRMVVLLDIDSVVGG